MYLPVDAEFFPGREAASCSRIGGVFAFSTGDPRTNPQLVGVIYVDGGCYALFMSKYGVNIVALPWYIYMKMYLG